MTLRERFEQLFYKKQEEASTQERRKIEPLKPIYADKLWIDYMLCNIYLQKRDRIERDYNVRMEVVR